MPSHARDEGARKLDWAGLGWLFLFFWCFSGLTQALILATDTSGFTGFRQAFLLSGLWLIPVLLFPARTRTLAAVIGVMLWLASLPALFYFLVYGQEFSQSVIFIMFESNAAEASEYLTQYMTWWIPLVLLAYAAVAWLIWRRLRRCTCPPPGAGGQCRAAGRVARLPGDQADHGQRQLRAGHGRYRQAPRAGRALATGGGLPAVPPAAVEHAGPAGRQRPHRAARQPARHQRQPALDPGAGHRRVHQPPAHEPLWLLAPDHPNLDKLRDELQVFDNVVTRAPTPSRRWSRC